jgi:AAA+ ATPase superfamily predicted ATPase
MNNPFVYGKEVSGDSFCNRKAEIKELCRDIENSQNVIIFSQRRFGKTSLIKEVFRACDKKRISTIYVDLYPVLCEEDFIRLYAEAIAKVLHGSLKRGFKDIGKFFRKLRPSFKVDNEGEISYSFMIDQRDVHPSLRDVLESVQRYADIKNKKIAVCFDEFQQIAFFKTDKLEKTLRSSFQQHKNISYIFMGSKKHLIQKIFNSPNRPFYRSGKSFPLNKIKQEELEKFITDKFQRGKISITLEAIKNLIEICEIHPYYVQYLSHILWEKTADKEKVTEEDLRESLELLLKRESSTYEAALDGLTLKQKQVLIALSKSSPQDKVFSSKFLRQYNLDSASSMQRILSSLINKDLIDKEGNSYTILDVFFKKWLSQL